MKRLVLAMTVLAMTVLAMTVLANAVARAQETPPEPSVEVEPDELEVEPDELEVEPDEVLVPPAPSIYRSAAPEPYGRRADDRRWDPAPPDGPTGIANPTSGTTPDDGLMIAGLVLTLSAFTVATAVSLPSTITECGWGACNRWLSAFSVVPLAHWAGGFSGAQASILAYTVGGVFSFVEFAGLMILLAGATHHHPVLIGRPARDVAVRFTGAGLEVSF